ncbi:hypothetical protein F2P81_001632 [Scophthalmus maximus]|uniref:Uncharacterized protein n=1 Tax=Scophthalmus maximus TaxID=52904 RepID=A0A6A4TGM8_SCOMX|nr:hypothetical protein F2P81_001632 [Scophthalmus maximus]
MARATVRHLCLAGKGAESENSRTTSAVQRTQTRLCPELIGPHSSSCNSIGRAALHSAVHLQTCCYCRSVVPVAALEMNPHRVGTALSVELEIPLNGCDAITGRRHTFALPTRERDSVVVRSDTSRSLHSSLRSPETRTGTVIEPTHLESPLLQRHIRFNTSDHDRCSTLLENCNLLRWSLCEIL